MGAAAVPFLIASTIASTAISAYSTIQAGKANAAQQQYQAEQAALNARRATANANAEAAANEREQVVLNKQKTSTLAAQKTAVSASGLTISGSALDVLTDADLEAELQLADSRFVSRIKQTNMLNQSQDFTAESGMLVRAARSTRRNTSYAAAGQVLSGAAQVAYYSK